MPAWTTKSHSATVISLALALFSFPAFGQPANESRRSPSELIPFDRFQGFADPLRGMNWEEEADRVRAAAQTMWQRNGWTDESDLFARDVAIEVTEIPPWDVSRRLNLLSTRIAERYGLSSDQSAKLQFSVYREAGRFFTKNSAAIFQFGRDALATRAQGRAFTSEQVRAWAAALPPLLADIRESVETLSEEIEPNLDETHRQRLRRDLASIDRRANYMDKMGTQWAAGKWNPRDWGLERDPIQSGALDEPVVAQPSANPPNPSAPTGLEVAPIAAVVIPTKWVAHEPKTWIAYVLEVEKRYSFDAGQQTTARSIHSELIARAANYSTGRRAELQSVPATQRATDELYEPIRSLFAQLQERLEALPTTAQRETSRR